MTIKGCEYKRRHTNCPNRPFAKIPSCTASNATPLLRSANRQHALRREGLWVRTPERRALNAGIFTNNLMLYWMGVGHYQAKALDHYQVNIYPVI